MTGISQWAPRRLSLAATVSLSLTFSLATARFTAFAAESSPKAPWQELREQLRTTRNFRLGAPFNFQILKNGQTLLYQKAIPPSTAAAVYSFDIKSGTEEKILDEGMLSAGDGPVSAEEKALRERLRLMTSGINFYEADETGDFLLTPLKGKLFVYDRKAQKGREIGSGKGSIYSPKFSVDGRRVAFVRGSNLFTIDRDGTHLKAVTKGGTEARSFGVAEFIAQEELGRMDGYWWSPDSRTLLYEAVDQTQVERLSIADPFRADAEPQRPYYPRPGKTNAKVRFGFTSADGGETTWVDFGKEAYEYVSTVRWTKNGPPTFFLLNRLQNTARLVAADPKTGKTTVLLQESDPAWVEIVNNVPVWLPDQKGFLWMTDRSGSRQIELHDVLGKEVRSLTVPHVEVKNLLGIDDKGLKAFVEVATDGSHSALMSIDIATGASHLLLPVPDHGSVTASSKFQHGIFVAHTVDRLGLDETSLQNIDGTEKKLLPSSAAKPVMSAHVTLQTIGPDAVQTSIVRPSTFKPGEKYPVIDHAYGGPTSLMVRAGNRAYLEDQVMADALGAIIVRMDTRGTPDRGRSWEKAILHKFGTLPVNDHADNLKRLCKEFPEMDETRIGVFGWSYGGYFSAYAVLARPDVYKAGVAGAPPVDWLDYDTAYTERYLGIPGPDNKAYEVGSLLPLVKSETVQKTPRPLLIIHGTGDDNVFFFNSLKLVDALERRALPYEFLPLMGMTHIVSDEILDTRRFERTLDFFKRTLIQ